MQHRIPFFRPTIGRIDHRTSSMKSGIFRGFSMIVLATEVSFGPGHLVSRADLMTRS